VTAGYFARARDTLLAAAEASDPLPSWLLPAFPLLFAVMWLVVTTLLGLLAGHMALLARFPPVEEEPEETFSFASGVMRWVSFNNVLHVGIGAHGLHLAANVLFRPVFRRGIPCVPWREIGLLRSQAEGWVARFRGSKFEVRALGLGFTLYGRAGVAVERKLASLGLWPPAHARALVRER
jgi:hypothetical protein